MNMMSWWDGTGGREVRWRGGEKRAGGGGEIIVCVNMFNDVSCPPPLPVASLAQTATAWHQQSFEAYILFFSGSTG